MYLPSVSGWKGGGSRFLGHLLERALARLRPVPRRMRWRVGAPLLVLAFAAVGTAFASSATLTRQADRDGTAGIRRGSASASPYVALQLGASGLVESHAVALNDSGLIVGYGATRSSSYHALLWLRGRLLDLNTLAGGRYSRAYDVNAAGDVVGERDFGRSQHAFLWSQGKMTDLGTFGGDGLSSGAWGINASRQVVGWSEVPGGERGRHGWHAFLWSKGKMDDLGTLADSDYTGGAASAVNAAGQAVGAAYVPDPGTKETVSEAAVSWAHGTVTRLSAPAFPPNSGALAINDSGQIVGWLGDTYAGTNQRAVLWSNGKMIDLGARGEAARATAINASGVVVGSRDIAIDRWRSRSRPFLWSDGKMIDLETPRGFSAAASDVNASGLVVGSRWFGYGNEHATVWTNDMTLVATVPELKGKTLRSARTALLRGRCAVGRIARVYSKRIPAGRVISQSMRARTRTLRGTRVNLELSRGRRP